MTDTERPTYGALYDVPASLLDQACYARIVPAIKDAQTLTWEWRIGVYSETDRLLCVVVGFPAGAAARHQCEHARIEVR